MLLTLQTILNQIQELESLLFKLYGNTTAQTFLAMIDSQEIFIEKTAHEILWGYDDPIFGMLTQLGLAGSPQFAVRVRNIYLVLC